MEYGICFLPNIPVRTDHNECSEMTTELLFGESCMVIDSFESWSKIRNKADGYEGWLTSKMLTFFSEQEYEAYNPTKQAVVSTLFSKAVNPMTGEHLLLTGGSLLPGYTPDGSFRVKGERYRLNPEDVKPVSETILKTAYKFLHSPYLWGGKNAMGMDCSGLAQVVFRIHGIQLLRNARHQATQGELVSFLQESLPGDLAFFENAGGNITHVGIVAENGHVIHCSGSVRIDKLDDEGIFNEEKGIYTHKLRLVKRLIAE